MNQKITSLRLTGGVCVVALSKTFHTLLTLVQPRKTENCPEMT